MSKSDTDKTSILIVDDMPEKLLVYKTVLDELDQNLVPVLSGAEALRHVLRTDFAVILLDVNMPGMDGFETARFIRQRKRSAHTPIIFLTAFTDEMRTAEGYAHGAVDYILTPVVPEILRAKVRVFVELFRMRRQVALQAEEQAKRAAAEEVARRSAFLAEASRVLTSSLDFDATLRGLLKLVVPSLADLAAVTQASTPYRSWSSELAWILPDGEIHYHSLTSPEAPRDELRNCHDRVLDTGKAEVLQGVDIAYPADITVQSSDRIRSAVVLPLVARDRTLGVLTLAHQLPDRFSQSDIALAEDLASRAAIALDNARLYRDIQDNDQRKNEFLAMLAHELRNPLAPVRNAVALLRAVETRQQERDWARDLIDRQFNHLVRLVDDLLDVSRITQGKIKFNPEILDANQIVATALETSRPLVEAHGHTLEVSVPDYPLRIKADPARLTQVLTNLLNNAAKYTPDGGRIWLTVEREEDEVVFRVRDTGAGIPPEMLGKVFDLFTQVDHSLARSQGGLGIGLTLVHRLVEMHGGSVQAFSEGPGTGSEFTVRMPLMTESPVSKPRSEEFHLPRASPEIHRALVVDDNRDAADSLGMLLRLSGHEVQLAYDGPSALEEATTFQPDVVVLDIGLPGLDGYEVARRLRQRPGGWSILLIAISGYGQEEDMKRSQEVGFDHHLIKPVDFDTLRRLLSISARANGSDRAKLASARVGNLPEQFARPCPD